ncbi:MAG: hypothetical protein K0U86_09220 [Planctomycetes bacterium]|nr:hypothetical protein [Planctomycetota bacterium]MCH9725070.1 hypothetical protein [Planctomycetota bacterium]MCH9779356.1 hypothetical protein [Planctomycetota bacterium]
MITTYRTPSVAYRPPLDPVQPLINRVQPPIAQQKNLDTTTPLKKMIHSQNSHHWNQPQRLGVRRRS